VPALKSEAGQTTTELGLILVILSIAALAVVSIVAGSVNDLYSHAESLIHEAIT